VKATRGEPISGWSNDARRLWTWLAGRATTFEAKTGYHLDAKASSRHAMLGASASAKMPRIEVYVPRRHALPPDRGRAWARTRSRSRHGAPTRTRRRAFWMCSATRYFSVPQSRAISRRASGPG